MLPADPAVRFVTLANGFTCWIRRHPRPAGAVALCLRVGSGSLDEEANERGISHLLEHMAFRGSANFPPGTLPDLFGRLGTRVGRHQNASTGLDHTSFRLSIPDADDRALHSFLLCLADFAYRLSLQADEVEREKKVVLEELRAYPRSEARLRERILGLLLPGSRLASRRPLGTEETVAALSAEQLRAHYARWHRPDNTVLLVVGDVDVGRVEELVGLHFGAWTPAAAPPRRADLGVHPLRGTRTAIVEEPDAAEAEVRVVSVLPRLPLRTAGDFRARLVERIGLWAVNRRINTLVREGRAPFRDAELSLASLAGSCTLARATASGPPAEFEAVLEALLVEIRRAGAHPPPEEELDRARSALLTGARQGVVSEGNRSADSLLAELEEALGDGRTPVGRREVLDLAEASAPGVTGDEVRDALASEFVVPGRLVVAILPDITSAAAGGDGGLAAVARRVESRPVEAPPARPHPRRLMARRPVPGGVEVAEEDRELGVTSATLSNGVRLHVREMGYRRCRVFVTVTVAGGRIREEPANLGVTSAAALAWAEPATADHSSVAIRDCLSGKAVAFEVRVEEDAVELRLAADPADLEDGLQLLHLLLTRPRVEPAAFNRWRDRARDSARARTRSLEVQLAERSLRLLTGGDPRFGILEPANVEALALDAAQRWLDEVLCRAPVEAAFVGDLAGERMTDLALRYLGSLPGRERRDRSLDALRTLPLVSGPVRETAVVEAPPSTAAVLVGWRAVPWHAVRERHALQLAEQVLLDRVRSELREARGMSYSPEVSFNPSRAYPAASFLSASTYSAPARADEAAGILRQVAEGLAADGPTDGEMRTVRKQFAEVVSRVQQDPKYWSRTLADLDYHGTRLADLKALPGVFAGCTAAELREALAGVIVEDRRVEVVCCPSSGVGPGASPR